MALRFIDAVGVTQGGNEARKWNNTSFIQYHSSGGRRNAAYYGFTSGQMQKTLTHGTRFIQGCAWAWQNTNNQGMMGVWNDQAKICQIIVNGDYTVSLQFGDSSPVFLGPSARAISAPTEWHYYELDAQFSNVGGKFVGTCTMRLDGAVFVSGTVTTNILASQMTNGSCTVNQIGFETVGTASMMDYYCADDATTDINGHPAITTAMIGDVEIDALMPVTDVTTNMSTFGGDGTHAWSCVNETPADDDTSYVFTSSVGNAEAFNHQPILGFTGTIVGAQYTVCARKDSEGLRTFTAQVGTETVTSVEFLSAPQYLSEYYFYYNFPLDSDHGVAWTTALYNAETFGVKLNS